MLVIYQGTFGISQIFMGKQGPYYNMETKYQVSFQIPATHF